MTRQFLQDSKDILRGAKASLAGAGGRLTARILLMLAAGNWYGVTALGLLGETAALIEITAAIGALGLRRALLGILAKAEISKKPLQQCIIDAVLLVLVVGGSLCLLLVLIWPLIHAGGHQVPAAVAIAVPCIMLTEVALAATRFRRIIRWNVLSRSIVEPWSFLILVIVGHWLELGMSVLLWAYLLSLILAMGIALIGLIRVYTWRRLLSFTPKPVNAIQIAQISFPTGLLEISSMLFRRIDILILGLVAGPAATGVYYMAQQVATVVHKIHDLFEPMMSPVIAQAEQRGDHQQIGTQLATTCRWILTIQLGIAAPLVIFGAGVLDSFGAGFATGMLAMTILFLGEIADGSFALSELPLVFARPKIPPLLAGCALLLEIAAVYLLGRLYGPVGAAMGFSVAMLVLCVLRLTLLHHTFRLQLLNLTFIPALIITALLAALLLILQQTLTPFTGISLWATILLTLISYLLLIRRFALSPADIELFQNLRKPA